MHGITGAPVPADDGRCLYVTGGDAPGEGDIGTFCDAPRRPGSVYCPAHHALCHFTAGSQAEERQGQAIEALARAVGGRLGRELRAPPDPLLRRLDRIERAFSRPHRSRIVLKEAEMLTAGRNTRAGSPQSEGRPTPERLQHGPVERLQQPIADAGGAPSRPYRAVDTLLIMERRGSITASMRQAGEDFRARFAVAQLDPLRALDLAHLRIAEEGPRPEQDAPGLRIEAARRAVWRAIQAVGGIASPAGSCAWHVLGWQQSVKEWAIGQGWSGRRVTQEVAAGILIAALGALETHFTARSLSS